MGEPLFQDVMTTLAEVRFGPQDAAPQVAPELVIGGRYGLGSKEFSPAMAKAVFDELSKLRPRPRFTVGIVDDVTRLSLPVDESFDIEPHNVGARGVLRARR